MTCSNISFGLLVIKNEIIWPYCWWLKSGIHQLRSVVYPNIKRVLYIPGGCLGFLPSTVFRKNGIVTRFPYWWLLASAISDFSKGSLQLLYFPKHNLIHSQLKDSSSYYPFFVFQWKSAANNYNSCIPTQKLVGGFNPFVKLDHSPRGEHKKCLKPPPSFHYTGCLIGILIPICCKL